MQGIETVRRDNCLMVRKLVTKILDCLLKDRDLDTAVEHVKAVIADLLLNRVDMSDLVVSKNLSQVTPLPLTLPLMYHAQLQDFTIGSRYLARKIHILDNLCCTASSCPEPRARGWFRLLCGTAPPTAG